MSDHYEMPHLFADHCIHAGVGKACRPCREMFSRIAVEALRDAARRMDELAQEEADKYVRTAGMRTAFERAGNVIHRMADQTEKEANQSDNRTPDEEKAIRDGYRVLPSTFLGDGTIVHKGDHVRFGDQPTVRKVTAIVLHTTGQVTIGGVDVERPHTVARHYGADGTTKANVGEAFDE